MKVRIRTLHGSVVWIDLFAADFRFEDNGDIFVDTYGENGFYQLDPKYWSENRYKAFLRKASTYYADATTEDECIRVTHYNGEADWTIEGSALRESLMIQAPGPEGQLYDALAQQVNAVLQVKAPE